MTTAPELKEAYGLIKSGDKAAARDVLVAYLDDMPNDANAWWLMANALEDREMRKESLERVLELNPGFEQAEKALAKLTHAASVPEKRKTPPTSSEPKRKMGGSTIYTYPLHMRFKIIAFAPQIYITDASDNPILFVRQKIWNLKEDVRIFRDDSKTDEVFRINANKIIDIGARYYFTDSQTERPLGSIKQRGLKTIWRAHYDIETPSEEAEHDLTEDNPWVKVGDALLGEIPFVGFFTGFFLHPSFTIHDTSRTPIMRLTKEPAFFESKFRIEMLEPSITPEEEKRLLLSMMMMGAVNTLSRLICVTYNLDKPMQGGICALHFVFYTVTIPNMALYFNTSIWFRQSDKS